jgi:anti-anti-sigma factor
VVAASGDDPAPDPVTVDLVGELDEHSARELTDPFTAHPEARRITLDASGVTFLDSAGLRVLASWHFTARSSGRMLVLRAPSDVVRRLLEITTFDAVFVIEEPSSKRTGSERTGSERTGPNAT